MAKDGFTIRVCGLPTDINENRLSDKLIIHFLRKKNGGGDISSVTFPKMTPGSALVTFEGSEVAQRVITHGNHKLLINDNQYPMTVSLYKKGTDPDELFIDIAVTVDYNQLPGGRAALSDLRKKFPDIKFTFDPHDNLCILRGCYSEIQTLTAVLLSGLNSNNCSQDLQFSKPEVRSDQKRCHSNGGRDDSQEECEFSGQAYGLDHSECSDSERSRSPPHTSDYSYSEVSGALAERPTLEDLSMVIDTDIFRYLQHCSVEYKNILDRHGVAVLDVTTKDITTLFLQARQAVGSMESLGRAHEELSWLYQEKEAQLRKVHLPKEGLHIQELQQAIEVLTQTFPKLLINEDKANIYLVGTGSSVSEAKQFLVDMGPTTDEYSRDKNKPSDFLFQASGASSLSFTADKQSGRGGAKANFYFSSLSEVKTFQDGQMSPLQSMSPSNSQRFDSGPTAGIKSSEAEPLLSTSMPKDLKIITETAGDTLSKRPLSPSFGLNSPNGTTKAAQFSASRSYSLDYTLKVAPSDPVKHPSSGSVLRQTNSLSRRVRSKQYGGTGSSNVNTVSSLKLDNTSETKEIFSVEVMVPITHWVYMKKHHCTELENLTTDLQMKVTETGKDATLHLKGADAANVGRTQQGLKELVAKVAKDFSTKELPLVNVGASDSKKDDKTTMDQSTSLPKDSVERMPTDYRQPEAKRRDREPKPEYRENEDVLKNDFLNPAQKKPDALLSFIKEIPTVSQNAPVSRLPLVPAELLEKKSVRTRAQGDTSSRVKERKGSIPFSDFSSQMSEGPKSESFWMLRTNERQTDDVDSHSTINHTRVNEQRQDEALGGGHAARSFEVGTREESTSKIVDQCPWCRGKVNPYCSSCPRPNTPTQLSSNEEHAGAICSGDQKQERGLFCKCGATAESVPVHGVSLCLKCKEKDHYNRPKELVSGIRGTMTQAEMSCSLVGYSKDTTLKLTYDIPDGIQGTEHPNPGAPFLGGKFSAFLPMNDFTRRLLPSLEQAFHKGITFTVKATDIGDTVTWGRSIPHKTSMEGGLSRNGFPDAGYLKRLAATLKAKGD